MASKENMDEFDIDVLNDSKKSKSPKKSGKRVNKDKKFGFGGQKRNRKSNTAESTANLGDFNVKKMKKRLK
jgi:rRNA-processing protein EBP2